MQPGATVGWTAEAVLYVTIVVVLAVRWLRLSYLRKQVSATLIGEGAWPKGPAGPAHFDRSNIGALTSRDGIIPGIEEDRTRSRPWLNGAEYAAYGAVSAASVAWSLASIDPDIVAAADFASEATIGSGFDYAQYIHAHMAGFSDAAKEGFISRLQGYLGERHVADILIAQGHTVELASAANQPIWDLLVDGHAVNVKTVADTASVLHVAAEHPDVTYIVPLDAHGETAHNVTHLEGFSHDTVKEAVHESIAASHGDTALQWIMHHVPWVSLAFSTMRQYRAVEKGKPIGVAIDHGVADTLGKGGGAMLGAKTGAAIGTLFGPAGTLIGTVAGALMLGIAGGKLATHWKERGLRRSIEVLRDRLHDFAAGFADRLTEMRDYLEAPLRTKERSLSTLEDHIRGRKSSWRWWLWPDFQTVLLDEAAKVGRAAVMAERAAVARVTAIIEKAKATGRYEEIGLILANSPVIRELMGCSDAALEPIRQAREAVLTERRHLNPDLAAQVR